MSKFKLSNYDVNNHRAIKLWLISCSPYNQKTTTLFHSILDEMENDTIEILYHLIFNPNLAEVLTDSEVYCNTVRSANTKLLAESKFHHEAVPIHNCVQNNKNNINTTTPNIDNNTPTNSTNINQFQTPRQHPEPPQNTPSFFKQYGCTYLLNFNFDVNWNQQSSLSQQNQQHRHFSSTQSVDSLSSVDSTSTTQSTQSNQSTTTIFSTLAQPPTPSFLPHSQSSTNNLPLSPNNTIPIAIPVADRFSLTQHKPTPSPHNNNTPVTTTTTSSSSFLQRSVSSGNNTIANVPITSPHQAINVNVNKDNNAAAKALSPHFESPEQNSLTPLQSPSSALSDNNNPESNKDEKDVNSIKENTKDTSCHNKIKLVSKVINATPIHPHLPVEPNRGCIEYKLLFAPHSMSRSDTLLTQLMFRIQQSPNYTAFYCLGVDDLGFIRLPLSGSLTMEYYDLFCLGLNNNPIPVGSYRNNIRLRSQLEQFQTQLNQQRVFTRLSPPQNQAKSPTNSPNAHRTNDGGIVYNGLSSSDEDDMQIHRLKQQVVNIAHMVSIIWMYHLVSKLNQNALFQQQVRFPAVYQPNDNNEVLYYNGSTAIGSTNSLDNNNYYTPLQHHSTIPSHLPQSSSLTSPISTSRDSNTPMVLTTLPYYYTFSIDFVIPTMITANSLPVSVTVNPNRPQKKNASPQLHQNQFVNGEYD